MRMLKSRIIMIALAAVLCISTVIGAAYTYTYTYASETAESQSGGTVTTLDEVDIQVSYFDEAKGEWVRMLEEEELKLRTAQQDPLFNGVIFEPGKMVVRKIMIQNVGANRMDYGVKFTRTAGPATAKDLAEVIEVYTGAAKMDGDVMISPANRSDVLATSGHGKGKLADLFGQDKFVQGALSEGGTQYAYIALYMPPTVDDSYQQASAGEFTITWGAGDAYGTTGNN